MQSAENIGYLGAAFSYHHIAASHYFGNGQTFTGYATFPELISALQLNRIGHAVIAVENSIAGDVAGNFEMVANSGKIISGEIALSLSLQLAGTEGATLSSLHTVYSHPMAIRETAAFFSKYPHIHLVETTSTSGAVKMAAELAQPTVGAIGSAAAIEHFGLKAIVKGIDDHQPNVTRFLILSHKYMAVDTTNTKIKSSLLLTPEHHTSVIEKLGEATFSDFITCVRYFSSGNIYLETKAAGSDAIGAWTENVRKYVCPCSILGKYPPGATYNS